MKEPARVRLVVSRGTLVPVSSSYALSQAGRNDDWTDGDSVQLWFYGRWVDGRIAWATADEICVERVGLSADKPGRRCQVMTSESARTRVRRAP